MDFLLWQAPSQGFKNREDLCIMQLKLVCWTLEIIDKSNGGDAGRSSTTQTDATTQLYYTDND